MYVYLTKQAKWGSGSDLNAVIHFEIYSTSVICFKISHEEFYQGEYVAILSLIVSLRKRHGAKRESIQDNP